MQQIISKAPTNWFLTDRSLFLLSNQIFYNVETVRYMQCITHNTKEGERNDKSFMISQIGLRGLCVILWKPAT